MQAVQAALQHLHVGEDQLQIDGLHVPHGIDAAVHVGHVLVVKAPDDVQYGVHLTDVAEKLVAEPLTLAGALDEARDVHKLHYGGGELVRVVHTGQIVQPGVRHCDDTHIGVYCAKRVIGGLG